MVEKLDFVAGFMYEIINVKNSLICPYSTSKKVHPTVFDLIFIFKRPNLADDFLESNNKSWEPQLS